MGYSPVKGSSQVRGPVETSGTGSQTAVGYVPGAEALAAVKDLAIKVKQMNPELIYLLDRASEGHLPLDDDF